ncbi:TFIIB-type zinc ribbon-containing protein [Halobaculum litoreum]|uniref:TFIIB-type zinc ribbon-containing protein n=1 Tax=Halobaculum litoreum TaxID=3031998 RepID=A0ABD5XW03_9EURY
MSIEIENPMCPNCGSDEAAIDHESGEFWCDDCDLYGEFSEIKPTGGPKASSN